MTKGVFGDLAEALASPEAAEDLVGVLAAWAEVAGGEVRPGDRVSLTPSGEVFLLAEEDRRLAAALTLAKDGPVGTAELGQRLGVCQETARLVCADLVRRCLLRAQGSNKNRRYVPAG